MSREDHLTPFTKNDNRARIAGMKSRRKGLDKQLQEMAGTLKTKNGLTYDEAINILSSQQSFLNYMETIDINGFPNFFKYLMNEDNIDIIEILLNIGLDVNNTVDTAGRSALHYVASAGANNLLNILIRY